MVGHHRPRRFAKHRAQLQVDGFFARAVVHKSELHIARGLTNHIHRRPFAVGNGPQFVDMLFVHHQPHPLLRLVADNLLVREGRVAHRELIEVNTSTGRFHQLREAVQVSPCPVVVDGDNRVIGFFGEGPNGIVSPPLHLGVRALNGVQFDGIGILARGHRRHGATAHPDTVVIPTEQHHFVARDGFILERIDLFAIANPPGQHNHLVEAESLAVFLMFERVERPGNQGLPKFIPEIRSPVRSLNQDIFRSLVEPFTRRDIAFPRASFRVVAQTRIGRHIAGRTGHRESPFPACDAVTNLTAGTRCRPVERFHGCREVVRFGLHRDDAFKILRHKVIRSFVRGRSKLFNHSPLQERAVVLVGRHHPTGIGRRGLLDEFEECFGFLLPVNHKLTVENLVAAVFRIDLRETKHLAVGQRTADFHRQVLQILYLVRIEGQPLFAVIALDILDIDNRFGLFVDGKDLTVNGAVHAIQHLVIGCRFAVHHAELFDAGNALNPHILGDFNRIGTPRRNHFAPRPHKDAAHGTYVEPFGVAEQPAQFVNILFGQRRGSLHGIDGVVATEE